MPSFPWLHLLMAGALGASLLGGVLLGRPHDLWRSAVSLWLVLCALAWLAYGLDKGLARLGWRRVPEAWLLALAACGGWAGGWAGRAWFEHKTVKPSFVRRFWLASAWSVALWALVSWAVLASR